MDSIRITAGDQTLTRFPDVELRVVRNGQEQTMRADQIRVGDQIQVGSNWAMVTKVECVDNMGGQYYKGSREYPSCFPNSAIVTLEDGRRVPISEVGTSSRVKAIDSSGKCIITTIFFQAHANPTARLLCVSISAGGKLMELSHGHYLFVVSADGHRRHVTARDVKVGDLILGYNDITADFRPTPVASVEHVERQGMYAPMTLEGSIVVNDVACSCYTDTFSMDPATAHALLWPLRRLWQVSPAGLALVCKPCDLEGRPALAGWFLDNVLSLLPTSTPL